MQKESLAAIASLLPPELALQLTTSELGASEAANMWFIDHIQKIQRFVPKTMVETWQPDADRQFTSPSIWNGSFLLADLSSFTAASEVLTSLGNEGAEEITRVITQLFTLLIDKITIYGGDIIRFSGDALLAFFNSEHIEQHAGYACQAALDIQHEMRKQGHVKTRGQALDLEMRIGIHVGTIYALSVGSPEHRELSLFGDDLKRVTTAQHLADPGEIVISQATTNHIQAEFKPIDAQYTQLIALESAIDHITILAPTLYGEQFPLEHNAAFYRWLKTLTPQHLTIEQLVSEPYSTVNSIRLVTILFAQFSHIHEEISEHFSLEELSGILNQIYQQVQTTINRFGGTVNKLDFDQNGERLIALFGAPISNDNDANLATQAAFTLEIELAKILSDIAQMTGYMIPLMMQISINSGHVFAGFVGSPQRLEYTVMGDTVNVAARLLQVTEPNTVTAGPLTTSIIGPHFDTLELPAARVKGKKEPVQPTRVLGIRSVPVLKSQVPLIGRSTEINSLLDQIKELDQGNGQTISIQGEPGIGKSRLLSELINQVHKLYPGIIVLHAECQFHEQITPFGVLRPLIYQLAQQHRIAQSVEQLTNWVERLAPGLSRFIPLLGEILQQEFPESPLLEGLSAEQRHHRSLDLIEAIFLACTKEHPILIIIDDIHWIDLPSKELIKRLYEAVDNYALGLCIAYRPMIMAEEYHKSAIINLQELRTDSLIDLAKAFLNSDVPEELIQYWTKSDQIYFNPQGNPFFIQEVLRTLILQDVLYKDEQGWHISGDITALPTTIEGVIAARLDQLPALTKEVAQHAAVIGRRFSHQLLEYLLPDTALEQHLEYLQKVDIIIPDILSADPISMFKHDLTREVAYQRILYARRRELHAQVASAMEDLFSYRMEEIQPLLAHHYADAEDWLTAARYGIGAGKRAQEQYFNHEAIEHYSDAIKWLEQASNAPKKMLIELYERRGYVQTKVGDYEEALVSLQQALYRVQSSHINPSEIARIMRHMATIYERRSEYELCLKILEDALNVLNNQHIVERARVLLVGAGPHLRQGRYNDVIKWVEEALEIASAEGAFLEQMHAYKLLGTAHAMIGNTDTAIEFYQKSIDIAERLEPPDLTRLSDVYNDLAITLGERGQTNDAIELYKRAYDIKTMIGDVYGQALLMTNLGEAYRKIELIDEAITSFQAALERWEALGSRYGIAVTNINLGATLIAREGFIAARGFLDQSLLLCEEIGSEEFLSEIERHYADLELQTGNLDIALIHIQNAIGHAQRLEARLDEGLAEHLHGRIWLALADFQHAVVALEQALVIFEQVEDKDSQQACLEDLAKAWYALDPERSRTYASQSLKLRTTL